jgi:hypothetical protein
MWTVPAKVAGAWDVKIKNGQGEQQAKLDLKQNINKVTGTAKIGEKESQITDAKLIGDQLTFALSDQPDVKYTCKIDGSSISGTAKGNGAAGEAQLAGSKQAGGRGGARSAEVRSTGQARGAVRSALTVVMDGNETATSAPGRAVAVFFSFSPH